MSRKPLLLVEDNPDDELLTLRALSKATLANPVTVVRDGAEALDYLLGTAAGTGPGAHELPAVVLLDLKLPKVDGLEVLSALRADKRTELLPVVVLTSSDEEADITTSYELGANSYVRKPVSFDEFSKAVTQLGLYWLALNRPPSALS